MKAIVLKKTCMPEELEVSEVPIPEVKPGWILIKVRAFGLNRSELIMRAYEADASYIKLPLIPGIECAGEVADASDTGLIKGQRVVALMGGMGRSFNGSYAEFTLVPSKNVFIVDTRFGWNELAAIPETYFTSFGSLFESLQLKPADTLLIRGGSSALGLASAQLAKSVGACVLATTRKKEKTGLLLSQGADEVLIDDGTLTEQLYRSHPNGISKVLELIGPATLPESAKMLSRNGIICSTGILGKKNLLNNFDPVKDLNPGTYLTGFFSNYPTQKAIDCIFDHLNKKNLVPCISGIFPLDATGQAHRLMEENLANGKIVINTQK